MLFRLIWVGSHKVRADEELAAAIPRHTRRKLYPLSLHVPPYPHPTILTQFLFWPGIWSLFCFFFLNPLFIICFIFLISLVFVLCLSLWLLGVLSPSLYLSLSLAGSVCRSHVSVRLSVRAFVCLSFRQAGGPRHVRRVRGPLTSCVAGGPESVPA